MELKQRFVSFSLDHTRQITWIMILVTLACAAFMPFMRVDTDPENMLSEETPVRLFHHQTKEAFALSDIVVLGVVNEQHPQGVFNLASLNRIYELTEFARRWRSAADPNEGVVEIDLLAPSLVDHISQSGPGVIRFEWLMPQPPATEAEALAIRDKMLSNPLLRGTLVSEDGKALCLYIPLTNKDLSHELYQALSDRIAGFKGDEHYHITGLPVAEDTFGYEMFVQMAISAPLAMAVIFVLMLLFFRKLVLVVAPMIVAIVTVVCTMGLLIAFGHPVHIMSSMIPIFLMPIAVVDSVHILSEFFDRYTKEKGRREVLTEVMTSLFMPMLYTSITSAAGFASLALTPIPPVRVFGMFVATGIMFAWVCTVLYVPAYIMSIKDARLDNFGAAAVHEERQTPLARLLRSGGTSIYRAHKAIIGGALVLTGIALYGILQIQINDNPIKWFSTKHPIRQADIELNRHFGGTYMAYLVLEDDAPNLVSEDVEFIGNMRARLATQANQLQAEFSQAPAVFAALDGMTQEANAPGLTKTAYLDRLIETASERAADANDARADVWDEAVAFLETEKQALELFKQPAVLDYVARLQAHLDANGLVGKSNSVADIVKKVHQELIDGTEANHRIPDSAAAVAQCLIQFQSSHTPDDLWHFVTQDFRRANLWLQLRSGDNRDMAAVVQTVDQFMQQNPPPVALEHDWAGLTYINVIWQDQMVKGMVYSLLGSFVIVFILMSVLFRSVVWGILCMIPLTITITFIYGVIGLIGKDYDMPVAVLSSLTLGMAVDFAIHFLERARETFRRTGSWRESVAIMFDEPARAISRNVLVIAIGFLPLLAAPLIPYKTVGVFLCAIMALSGVVTLTILPAVLTLFQKSLFKPATAPSETEA